jgi:hypothetical protein
MADWFGSQTTTTTPGGSPVPAGLFNQTVQNLSAFPNPYTMSDPQWAALGNVLTAAGQPLPDPVGGNPAWQGYLQGQQQLQGLMGGFQAPPVGTSFTAPQVGTQFSGQGYAPVSVSGFSPSAAGFTPSAARYGAVSVPSQAPVTTAQIDPAQAYAAAGQTLQTLAGPQIRAALQAAGMGRSGAEAEALAQGAAQLQLPINLQVLQSQAQANQLDASIKAKQQESQMLAQVQAQLQAQSLTATSAQQAQAIQAQLAAVNAQLAQNANTIQFQGQLQAALSAQGLTAQSQIQANQLGLQGQIANQGAALQAGQLGLQGQIANTNAAMQGYGMNLGAMTSMQNQQAQLAQAFPGMFNQNYLTGLTGAQAGLQATNFPQSLDIQALQNQQQFLNQMLGNMRQGSSTTTSTDPGILGLAGGAAGTAALLGQSLFGNQPGGLVGLLGNLFGGGGGTYPGLTLPPIDPMLGTGAGVDPLVGYAGSLLGGGAAPYDPFAFTPAAASSLFDPSQFGFDPTFASLFGGDDWGWY